jgi:hypothetical protein
MLVRTFVCLSTVLWLSSVARAGEEGEAAACAPSSLGAAPGADALLAMGKACEAADRPREAYDLYFRAARIGEGELAKEARAGVKRAGKRVPRLLVVPSGADETVGLDLQIDGKRVDAADLRQPMAVDAGDHDLRGSWRVTDRGDKTQDPDAQELSFERRVRLRQGDGVVRVRLPEPELVLEQPGLIAPGAVLVAAGGAGLATASILAAVSKIERNDDLETPGLVVGLSSLAVAGTGLALLIVGVTDKQVKLVDGAAIPRVDVGIGSVSAQWAF